MRCYTGQNLPRTHARPSFSEAWWYHRFGLEFGEKYHLDPVFRTEQERQMQRLLYETFGKLGLGQPDPLPAPHLDICGHRFLPALFGAEIVYEKDQAAACLHLTIDSDSDLDRLQLPDLETNRWAIEFRRQADTLFWRYGTVDATINHGGPLNVAHNLLGTVTFEFIADSSPAFQCFLTRVAQLCLTTYDQLTLRYNPELGTGRQMFIGNCPVLMIAPQTYRAQVLPHDLFLRQYVHKLGLHHCGPMDRYLVAYQELQPLNYIEVGWGSDLTAVRRAFPATILDLMINIYTLESMSEGEIRDTVQTMVKRAAPVTLIRDIWIDSIGPDVADHIIEVFVDAVNETIGGSTTSESGGKP